MSPDDPPTEPDAGTPSGRSGADQLRDRGRRARRSLAGPERRAGEQLLVAHLLRWLREIRVHPGAIGMYLPTDGEADLTGAVDPLRGAGWRIFLPVVLPGRRLAFGEWVAGATLQQNRFGVGEPALGTGEGRRADELDVVVVPCVAVDRRGHRLGFGAGFYDRALAEVPHGGPPLVVGVAFEAQVSPEVPARAWDVSMPHLLTEAGLVATRSG